MVLPFCFFFLALTWCISSLDTCIQCKIVIFIVCVCVCCFSSSGKFSCYEDYSIKMWSSWWTCCTMKRSRKYILLMNNAFFFFFVRSFLPSHYRNCDHTAVFTHRSHFWCYFSHVYKGPWLFLRWCEMCRKGIHCFREVGKSSIRV